MKYFYLPFLLPVCWCLNSYAQGSNQSKISPPSPQAASFQRYGDHPVGHVTGVPEISIPLYTINTSKLSLPISLSYHAGGFRPRESSGNVGLGWSLHAGGRISRTVAGDPDELAGTPASIIPAGQLAGTTAQNADASKRLYQILLAADETFSGTDLQPDIFYYSFPTGSGKFLLKNIFDANGIYTGSNKPVTVPFRPLKIASNTPTFNAAFTYFEIVDENGVTYRYGRSVASIDAIETTIPDQKNAGRSFTTSWLLTDVISQGGKEHIILKYATGVYSTSNSRTDIGKISSYDNQNPPQSIGSFVTAGANAFPHINISQGIVNSTHYVTMLKSIEWENGKVLFSYEDGGNSPGVFDGNRLKSVEVFDVGSNLVQKHSFSQAFYTGDTKRFKLTRIDRLGVPAGAATETHLFEYNEPPQPAPNNPVDLKGLDYWGFYNGQNANTSLIPGHFKVLVTAKGGGQSSYSSGTANREADENATRYYVLKKITYPTAGFTEFEFEGNKVWWGGAARSAGGLRVKRIINNTDGQQEIKSYEYGGEQCDGCGFIRLNPFQIESFWTLGYTNRHAPLVSGCEAENFYVVKVSSDIVDGSSYFQTSPVIYTLATEYVGNINSNQGKTVFTYDSPSLGFANNPFIRYLSNVDFWKGSHLLSREAMAYTGGSYSTIWKENFLYTQVIRDSLQAQYIEPFATDADTGEPSFAHLICEHTKDAFHLFDYKIRTGSALLTQKQVIKNANAGGGITTTETYQYPADYLLPRSKTFTNSEGQTVETSFTYPFDDPAYVNMTNANVVNPILTETVKEGNSALKTKTGYICASGPWGTSNPCIYVPSVISTQRIDNNVAGPVETETTFNSYSDRGYPLEITSRDGLVTKLDWFTSGGNANMLASETLGANTAFPQIRTYQYYPLIGLKSISDANSKVTFYEYDRFNRLKTVRSNTAAGPVRASYCYNFAGQPIDCAPVVPTGLVTPVSLFLISDSQSPPLPVTLVSFVAVRQENQALLTWKTTSEINSDRFDIEHSINGKDWNLIGSVPARGERSDFEFYSFRDLNPAGGENLYRLKMVDKDSSFAYSQIENLRFESEVVLYPNPVSDGKVYLESAAKIHQIRIFDSRGNSVVNWHLAHGSLDVSRLPAGSYVIQISSANGLVSVHRIVKN
ncbi:T9SS type A sorting domain-containing protein [Dyadobacter aurulentus]|uniref:T9SS type A sorting domain-containing protein n=1 Tax=Dyadobacter sp. UC 10 TaxID=2605428 RepID=UPI0011F2E58D|nr:T9SS type A sorting domain-containing protein [Dyadobacter sp. UC 10]KAA0989165.1 T9SS type A sorting domain-containing protein [Dyadobacter sp. UC 10]